MKKILITGMQIAMLLFFVLGPAYSQSNEKELLNKGRSYFNKGMYDEAIAEFTKVIKVNSSNIEAYFARGVAYYNHGLQYLKKDNFDEAIANLNFDLAISDYNKVIEKFPNSFKFYVNRAGCYADKGDIVHAISDYGKAIELNPNNADSYSSRAYLYFRNKEYDKSWKDVDKAEALGYKFDPDFIKVLKKASSK